jgi:hypothetical protein
MTIRIETQYETFTTEFKNVDANMEQITLALTVEYWRCCHHRI